MNTNIKYQAFIFDMDGTIVDTNHIWEKAIRDCLGTRGVTLTDIQLEELLNKTQGLALSESCRILKDMACLNESVETLVQEKSHRANSLYKQGIKFIDGFTTFHKKLVEKNLKQGIATNADDDTLRITNEVLNLQNYFGNHMYGISQVNYKCKPQPDIYLHAAKQLEIDPVVCIAIEDSAHGIAAAKAAGMFCIGINTAKKPEQLEQADIIIDTYEEIDLEKILSKS